MPFEPHILAGRLLHIMESSILPLTQEEVSKGNKIFGAALIRKEDLSCLIAGTNNEIQNPLWHGEIHTLKLFYEIPPKRRPSTSELIFLSTHEPCSLCLSAITWAGFDNFYYFFSHTDSLNEFFIPHDLDILKEVFNIDPGGYNTRNKYWIAHSLRQIIQSLPAVHQKPLMVQCEKISEKYSALSDTYQQGKSENDIPLR